jgi:hypothetical protein
MGHVAPPQASLTGKSCTRLSRRNSLVSRGWTQPGESFEDYRSEEFQQACEILYAETDTVKNQQATCLRAERPVSVMDRDYTLVMVMQAFADYLRFKPTE